jgi:predicted secreted protein
MPWMSGIVVYVVLWWLVMFCVLPIGVEPARESHLGHDAGAPANPRIGFKVLLTTAIATVLFGGVYLIIISDWISFRPHAE